MPRVDVALSFKPKAETSISGSARSVLTKLLKCRLYDGCQEYTKRAMLSKASNDL